MRKFIYGPGIDEPIFILNLYGYYLYHFDGLGNVAALTDGYTGDIVERYEYDVFGKCTVHTNAGTDGEWMTDDDTIDTESACGNPYMFTGRRLDTETGLYYYRFRYYKPEIGRFLQPDPIGYADGLNMYSYCGNNPINWIDPLGLTGFGIGGSITAGVGLIGGTTGSMIVVDLDGNLGIFIHAGGGAYKGASASGTVDLSCFTGSIYDLNGGFWSGGVGGGEGLGLLAELNYPDGYQDKSSGTGMTVQFGGYGGTPVTCYGMREIGQVFPLNEVISWPIIRDYWGDVLTTPVFVSPWDDDRPFTIGWPDTSNRYQ